MGALIQGVHVIHDAGVQVMRYFNTQFWTDKALSGEVQHLQSKCYFNPGVMLVNLDAWRHNKIENKIEHWMNIQHNVMRIYELGSLPPMLLALAGDVEPIPNSWNKHDLGGPCREFNVEAANIMHWSGDGKPWRRLGQKYECEFDREWEKYDVKI
ncbi:hypothetical protein CYMTET_14700 [Cymbomonas tetramitiformis]|uniref:Hexosyltransferase n=1 Tax=Cymbomonas tetramitiformis TaxID=36881 RepID=A0AAE0GFU5_9CHLO|nr:hypothetical protein CYMTET_14700 [Cymbomonas tetramitiformis]